MTTMKTCNETLTSYVVEEGTKVIAEKAFAGDKSLVDITIPNSVRVIGPSAFEGCTSLRQVTIGKGVIRIRGFAFRGCTSLTQVNYNATSCLRECELDAVFNNCDNLHKVVIGHNVVKLPSHLFFDCSALTEITIPDSVTTIGRGVFLLCPKLSHIHLPNSVSKLGAYAFTTGSPLEVTIEEDNPHFHVEQGALYSKDMTTLYQLLGYDPSFQSFVVPRSVTHIAEYAFERRIYVNAPTSLTSLISLNPQPPECEPSTFIGIDVYDCSLSVPKGTKEAYASADGWKKFPNIKEIE